MKKKGFLLAEETLKMILAVIAIGFLAFFLTSLYFNSVDNQNRIKAEASLERLKDVIMNEEVSTEVVSDITPAGWNLFSFAGEKKPNSCSGENCLCICDDVVDTILFVTDRQIKECDGKGICEIVPELEDFGEIKIESPSISVEVLKSESKIIIRKK
ncbi:MAG TPA: hypothetical protein ENI22_00940 [Candidatus Pacearchaeota archaeon]|nr:hypothetical protein [Candidatus Pacearchaeota archaeon]